MRRPAAPARWRVWQRATAYVVTGAAALALVDTVAGDRLVGASTARDGQHVVLVLADPALRSAAAPALATWSAQTGTPVRTVWVPSARAVEEVRAGTPADVVLLQGEPALDRLRPELADRPQPVVRRGVWAAQVTGLGATLVIGLQVLLPVPGAPEETG